MLIQSTQSRSRAASLTFSCLFISRKSDSSFNWTRWETLLRFQRCLQSIIKSMADFAKFELFFEDQISFCQIRDTFL